jgi:hypothetical protein
MAVESRGVMILFFAMSAAMTRAIWTSPAMLTAYALAVMVLLAGAWYGAGGQELAARMSRKGRHHAGRRP